MKDLLETLNIDLAQFKDLDFDGLFEEREIQPFIEFLCDHLGNDNVLSDAERSEYAAISNDETLNDFVIPDLNNLLIYDVSQTHLEQLNTAVATSNTILGDFKELDQKLRNDELCLENEIAWYESEFLPQLQATMEKIIYDYKSITKNIFDCLNNAKCLTSIKLNDLSKELEKIKIVDSCYQELENENFLELPLKTANDIELLQKYSWENLDLLIKLNRFYKEEACSFFSWDKEQLCKLISAEFLNREADILQRKITIHHRTEQALNMEIDLEKNALTSAKCVEKLLLYLLNIFDDFDIINKDFVSSVNHIMIRTNGNESHKDCPVETIDLFPSLTKCQQYLNIPFDQFDVKYKLLTDIGSDFFSGPTTRISLLPYETLQTFHRISSKCNSFKKCQMNVCYTYKSAKEQVASDKNRNLKLLWMTFLVDPDKILKKIKFDRTHQVLDTTLRDTTMLGESNYLSILGSSKYFERK